MIRRVSLLLAAILFLLGNAHGNLQVGLAASKEIPKTATVEIILLTAPGINESESRWEITYEFRIANQTTLWEAWQQRKRNGGQQQRLGELIKQGSVKKMLRSPENRRVVFHIPLNVDIQERLKNQPSEWVKITPGHITEEQIRLSREQETKAQNFLFYPIINVYDAKLKKNIAISASRSWNFAEYRQAKFEITLAINEDGSYSTKSSLPTKARSN